MYDTWQSIKNVLNFETNIAVILKLCCITHTQFSISPARFPVYPYNQIKRPSFLTTFCIIEKGERQTFLCGSVYCQISLLLSVAYLPTMLHKQCIWWWHGLTRSGVLVHHGIQSGKQEEYDTDNVTCGGEDYTLWWSSGESRGDSQEKVTTIPPFFRGVPQMVPCKVNDWTDLVIDHMNSLNLICFQNNKFQEFVDFGEVLQQNCKGCHDRGTNNYWFTYFQLLWTSFWPSTTPCIGDWRFLAYDKIDWTQISVLFQESRIPTNKTIFMYLEN